MERSVFDMTLDLQRSYSPTQITVKRGDTHRTLRFFLADGGKPYALTGVRAVLTAQKPDGSHLFNECIVDGDRIDYELTSQTTGCPGQVECQLRLYGENDALLTTAAFTLTVEDTVYTDGDEAIESTDEATALTALMTEADEKLTRLDAVLAEKSRQYELIEEITLQEAVSSVYRTKDPNGVPYNFSAVRISVNYTAATRTASATIYLQAADNSNVIYHTATSAISTTNRGLFFIAKNDHGFAQYYCVDGGSYSGTLNVKSTPGYNDRMWKNCAKITIGTYTGSDPVLIPAGTVIRIYGIRG